MRYIAILNPAAGHGRAGRKRAAVEAALQRAGLSYAVWLSEAPRHAVALARQAATQADVVLAVGGDGTILEVSQGLIESRAPAHLGVIPLGTGNDFIKMIGMPLRLDAAVQSLVTASPRAVDYGLVQWKEDDQMNEQVFVNAVGVGFDALAAVEANALKFLPGFTGYLGAVLRTLRRWDGPPVRIEGQERPGARRLLYEGNLLLVTVGNGVSSGGMFYLTPRASIQDGLLDVCIVEQLSAARIVQVIPLALRGRHERAQEVHTYRVQTLSIAAMGGLPVHADGEILALRARNIALKVVPGGLSVLMPDTS